MDREQSHVRLIRQNVPAYFGDIKKATKDVNDVVLWWLRPIGAEDRHEKAIEILWKVHEQIDERFKRDVLEIIAAFEVKQVHES